ncbi:hypothetical protein HDU96_002314, partial [Phlyctochytrium bullatum]
PSAADLKKTLVKSCRTAAFKDHVRSQRFSDATGALLSWDHADVGMGDIIRRCAPLMHASTAGSASNAAVIAAVEARMAEMNRNMQRELRALRNPSRTHRDPQTELFMATVQELEETGGKYLIPPRDASDEAFRHFSELAFQTYRNETGLAPNAPIPTRPRTAFEIHLNEYRRGRYPLEHGNGANSSNPFSGALRQRSTSPGRVLGPCLLCKEEHFMKDCPKRAAAEEVWALWEGGLLDNGSLPAHLKSAEIFRR